MFIIFVNFNYKQKKDKNKMIDNKVKLNKVTFIFYFINV
jgi:hypothetical protein